MNTAMVDLISHLNGPIATLAAFLSREGRNENEIEETIMRVFKIEDSQLRTQVQHILAVTAMARELRGGDEAENFDDVNVDEVERQFDGFDAQAQLGEFERSGIASTSVDAPGAVVRSGETKVVPIFRGRRAAPISASTLPGYVAPDERPRMAAKRAVRPSERLGYLRLADGGSIEIGSDNGAVFAKFTRGRQSNAIEISSGLYVLTPSKTYFGYFKVENLAPENARKLIQQQREAPDQCIVIRKNT